MYLSERPLRESEQPRVCSMRGGKGAPKGAKPLSCGPLVSWSKKADKIDLLPTGKKNAMKSKGSTALESHKALKYKDGILQKQENFLQNV